MAERSHTRAEHIGSVPQAVAVDKAAALGIFDHRVGAADGIAGFSKLVERILDPGAFGGPIGHAGRWTILAGYGQLLGKDGIEWQLHLIDRDAVGTQLDRLADAIPPVIPIFTDHAGDEINVDLIKLRVLDPAIAAIDFLREMRPAVGLQDGVAEVFDAQA